MIRAVYAVATMDTKGTELEYVASRLRDAGVAVRTVDVGTGGDPVVAPNVTRDEVLGDRAPAATGDRGAAVTSMGEALGDFLRRETAAGRVAGVIGLGGSGGTALITAAMRTLPIGLPKLMVSTVAAGNTAGYVDCSDIVMMPSVVDVAGLNVVSRRILGNAAAAMTGMARQSTDVAEEASPTIGMTMFGVTTPCLTAVRERLEADGFDTLVFHAVGTGGRSMEQLVESGLIEGVLDITTTEVADEIVGGIFPAGPERFERLVQSGVPLVLSVGAVDMVNFGPRESVPAEFADRRLHMHNAQITLMRTTADENRRIAAWIADKLNRSRSPLTVLIPEGGVSALDAPGEAFWDPEADAALFDTLEASLAQGESRRIVRLPHHINDPQFAEAVVSEFRTLNAAPAARGQEPGSP